MEGAAGDPPRDARQGAGAAFLGLAALAGIAGAQALPLLQTLAAVLGVRWRALPGLARANADWLLVSGLGLVWLAASASWSLTPDAWERALKHVGVAGVALLFAGAAASTPQARRWTALGCWAAALLLVALGLAEALGGMPLNRALQPLETDLVRLSNNPGRGVTLLVLLHFPALAAARGLPPLGGVAIALGAGFLALQFDKAANWAALAAGWGAFGAVYVLPRLGLWLCGLVWAGWLLAFPWLVGPLQPLLERLPLSWRMRGGIWDFATARILEKPVQGWGFEAARSFTGTQRFDGVEIPNIPLHTHSGSLQTWLELGAVGAALGAVILLLSARAAARSLGSDRLAAAGAAGAAAAAFVFFNVSFGAWQEWLWAAFAAAAVSAASTFRPPQAAQTLSL